MAEPDVLLYLHGFQSSPQSTKVAQFQHYLQVHYPHLTLVCPQLACYPQAAWSQIEAVLDAFEGRILGVMGSSLGGFLAARVSYQQGCPAVVINPAARPFELLDDYLGEHRHPYTGEWYCLTSQHMKQLRQLVTPGSEVADRLWLLSQTGDEVLDFRQALQEYSGAKQTVECGGDHSFQGFERYCGAIVDFFINRSIHD